MIVEIVLALVTVVVVPATGYLAKKVLDTDKRQEAHEAEDTVMFESIKVWQTDFKDEQRDQSNKLDRLIEGNLRDATAANISHQAELRAAAASALVIVETAKRSALEVVAEAARVAMLNRPA